MSVINSFLFRRRYEIFLFFTVLLIRLPFFFRDFIDHDESTFILMGQSVADGHLPYDHLWDLKSPFLFYIFGLIEYVFPHSFVAIRFLGVAVIFISALLLFRIAWKAQLRNGFFIALGYVLLSSGFGSVQGVMSEHFAVVFILAGFFFFMQDKKTTYLFFSGLFFGCALLCKLNYAYAIAIFLLYFLIRDWRIAGIKTSFTNGVLAGVGVLLPFFLVALPYLITKEMNLFIDGVFLAPLTYGHNTGQGTLQNLSSTWWIIALGLIISYVAWKKRKLEQRDFVTGCIVLLLGTVYSFYSMGRVNGHYLIQAYPFIVLLVAGVILQKNVVPSLAAVSLVVLLLSFESILEYYRVGKNYAIYSTLYNGKSFEAIRELKKHGVENKKIFFTHYHIGYWLLHQYPLTKSTTHPSNIDRPWLFKYYGNTNKTSLEEVKDIMEKTKPEIIVSKYDYLALFYPGSVENQYFKGVVAKNYSFLHRDSVNRIFIWQRNQIP